jgi:hypothetical protein
VPSVATLCPWFAMAAWLTHISKTVITIEGTPYVNPIVTIIAMITIAPVCSETVYMVNRFKCHILNIFRYF